MKTSLNQHNAQYSIIRHKIIKRLIPLEIWIFFNFLLEFFFATVLDEGDDLYIKLLRGGTIFRGLGSLWGQIKDIFYGCMNFVVMKIKMMGIIEFYIVLKVILFFFYFLVGIGWRWRVFKQTQWCILRPFKEHICFLFGRSA